MQIPTLLLMALPPTKILEMQFSLFISIKTILLSSKFIQDKYSGYSQKEAAYIAGAVYDSSLVLSASVGILIVRT